MTPEEKEYKRRNEIADEVLSEIVDDRVREINHLNRAINSKLDSIVEHENSIIRLEKEIDELGGYVDYLTDEVISDYEEGKFDDVFNKKG